jgi:hypothetical protein
MTLPELATVYRTMASGVLAQPYVVRRIVRASGEVVDENERREAPIPVSDSALSSIQEGLRGVVRIPSERTEKLGVAPLAGLKACARRGRRRFATALQLIDAVHRSSSEALHLNGPPKCAIWNRRRRAPAASVAWA